MERIFLSSPYTDPDPEVRHKRYRSAVVATKAIMLRGFSCFSPIVHSHPLVEDDVLPNTHDFWSEQDCPWLEAATCVVVLPLPGWEQSKGVQTEVALANSLNIPVKTFAAFLESR